MEIKWSPFEAWWSKAKPVQQHDLSVTRRFLVCETANTDAVHIDEWIDADYDALTSAYRTVTVTPANGAARPLEGVAAPSIRQIAWEVEHTLAVGLATLKLEAAARSPENADPDLEGDSA